jgi:hypothetical protein
MFFPFGHARSMRIAVSDAAAEAPRVRAAVRRVLEEHGGQTTAAGDRITFVAPGWLRKRGGGNFKTVSAGTLTFGAGGGQLRISYEISFLRWTLVGTALSLIGFPILGGVSRSSAQAVAVFWLLLVGANNLIALVWFGHTVRRAAEGAAAPQAEPVPEPGRQVTSRGQRRAPSHRNPRED